MFWIKSSWASRYSNCVVAPLQAAACIQKLAFRHLSTVTIQERPVLEKYCFIQKSLHLSLFKLCSFNSSQASVSRMWPLIKSGPYWRSNGFLISISEKLCLNNIVGVQNKTKLNRCSSEWTQCPETILKEIEKTFNKT